jgi:hypothetical protein
MQQWHYKHPIRSPSKQDQKRRTREKHAIDAILCPCITLGPYNDDKQNKLKTIRLEERIPTNRDGKFRTDNRVSTVQQTASLMHFWTHTNTSREKYLILERINSANLLKRG